MMHAKCPDCPALDVAGTCPGQRVRTLCNRPDHREALRAAAEGRVLPAHADAAPETLARVAACPFRGPVLPVSMQAGGCRGAELSECRAGLGEKPGRVCLAACVACRDGSAIQPDSVAHPWPSGTRLVVARYREDLGWLDWCGLPATVYDSGDSPSGAPANAEVVARPNLGRGASESHAYLTHVVGRYDRLDDVTVFCQGHPFDHSPDFLRRLRLPYDRPTSLTVRYKADHPADAVKALDLVGSDRGFETRLGLATAGMISGAEWFDRGAWGRVFACPPPSPWWFGYGATWAVPRASILARPLAFWRSLLRLNEAAAAAGGSQCPGLHAWAFEALWRYLWSDPTEYHHREDLDP